MNKKGFTLLEVTLFLAISVGLTLIVFVGLGPRLREARFTNGVKQIEASINQDLARSKSGENQQSNFIVSCSYNTTLARLNITTSTTTGSTQGSVSSCVINGRVVIFQAAQKTIYYRSIVSVRIPQSSISGCTGSDQATFSWLAQCYQPLILGDTQQAPSSLKYPGGISQLSANTAFGYVTHPENGQTYYFSYRDGTTAVAYPVSLNTLNNAATTYNFSTDPASGKSVCLSLDTRTVSFVFNHKSIEPTVEVESGCTS